MKKSGRVVGATDRTATYIGGRMQTQDTVGRTEVNRIKARVRRGMGLVDRVKRHGFGHSCKHIYAVTIANARG